MSRSHAIHNEEVCDFLLEDKRFTDWVITTAFYSALHFVQSDIFPLTEDGEVYNDFDTYYSKKIINGSETGTKHNITKKLVKSYLPECLSYYRWLLDACMTSRYVNYNVSLPKAEMARKHLAEIKSRIRRDTSETPLSDK